MGGDKRLRKRTMMRDFRGLQDYDIYSIREIEIKNKRGTRERERESIKKYSYYFFFYHPFSSSKWTYKIIISS